MATTGKHCANTHNQVIVMTLDIFFVPLMGCVGTYFRFFFLCFLRTFDVWQAWKSEPVKKPHQQQQPSKQSPSTSSTKKMDHSSISIDTFDKQIKKPDTQTLQPQSQDKQRQPQQIRTDKLNQQQQQHLTKRTSNTARINGDDIDVDGYHDFGEYKNFVVIWTGLNEKHCISY